MIFFTFLLFWISIQFGQIIEDSIAYIIVLSIGIVHGSNDFTILKKQQNSKIDFLKSTGFYLSLIILCVVTYIIVPFFSILFFVFLSSYHFGEQHLENKFNGTFIFKSLLYMSYGLLIFSLIFIENIKDVELIMLNLTGEIIPETWIFRMLIFSCILLLSLYFFHFLRGIKNKLNVFKELFYILLLYLVFKTSSLILGFAIYFVLWHSLPSIIEQTKFLSGVYSFKTVYEYLKTALIYWMISIFGLVCAYYFLS